jgi:hypothetical protein
MNRWLAICFALAVALSLGTLASAQNKRAHESDNAGTCGSHCGTERWAIKTLSDSDSATPAAATPTNTSVSVLASKKAPAQLPANTRIAPIENEQVTVTALLIAWKEESGSTGDHDFHLVLADPNDHSKTIIAEIPDPQCSGACASGKVNAFKTGRQVLTTELGAAPQVTSAVAVVPPRLVEVTGVGFFDFNHGQDGLAPNCIEIHPVLKITVKGKEGSTAIPLPKGVKHTCGRE